MNKLMGFLELKEMRLPSVPWKQYTGSEELNSNLLWTIRSAVYRGNDLNLPRLIGEDSVKAKNFADQLLTSIGDKGMVIFYPYFIASKSGTLCVGTEKVVIEAVKEDLWNLVTNSDRNVTLIITDSDIETVGETDFLSQNEILELQKHVPEIRKIFRGDLLEGKDVLLEWSFSLSSDKEKNPIGNEKLVFYEARTI